MEIITIPVIVVICYAIGYCIKSFGSSDLADKLIPVVCTITGGIIGVVAFFTYPAIIPANDLFTALAIGLASGMASTGAYEIKEQLLKLAHK